MFYGYMIKPASSGFGAWQASYADGEGFEDDIDYIMDIEWEGFTVCQLGVDKLPDEVEDISGNIYGGGGKEYVSFKLNDDNKVIEDSICYFGIKYVQE